MADVPVLYRFIATGQDSVASAFKGILATAQSTSKGVAAAVQQTERVAKAARGSTGGAGSAERAAQREADMAARAAKRAADAKIREEQRALAHVAKIRERYFTEQQRQEAKAEAQRARDQERRWRDDQRHVRDTEKWKRVAAEKFERANERTRGERLRTIAGIGKDAALAGVGFGASLLGVVGQAAREGVQLQDVANRLSIASRGAGEKAVDPTTLRREFEAAALANPGVKATDVAAGAAGFVAKTGELGVARRFAGTFATVASASGASVEDISNAAADLFQKFDITSIEDMRNALAALTYQGKAGAFEIKDAAAQFAKMGAAAARFGVTKGAEGVKILGGLTQIARSSTGSPEQAATAVEATFRQLISKSKEIKNLGVNVFEKGSKSKTRDVRDVLVETIAKAKGGQTKLQEIFGDEGIRGISPLISAYNEAARGTKGTEAQKNAAGIEAMRAALAKAIDAPGDWSEVVKDAAQAQKSASAQLDAAWESVKAAVAREAVPALLRLAPTVIQLADNIGPAIVVFQALVEAAKDVVDVLKVIGVIKDKQATPAERLKKAQEELDTFNKGLSGRTGPITAEEFAKRQQLEAAVAAADKEAYTTITPGGLNARPTTAGDFGTQYQAAGDYGSLASGDAFGTAKFLAAAPVLAPLMTLDALGLTNFGGNDFFAKNVLGENQKQSDIRHEFEAQGVGTDTGAAEMKAAAAELRMAARALSDGKERGGSIVAD